MRLTKEGQKELEEIEAKSDDELTIQGMNRHEELVNKLLHGRE